MVRWVGNHDQQELVSPQLKPIPGEGPGRTMAGPIPSPEPEPELDVPVEGRVAGGMKMLTGSQKQQQPAFVHHHSHPHPRPHQHRRHHELLETTRMLQHQKNLTEAEQFLNREADE